jgi:hypothetical protein
MGVGVMSTARVPWVESDSESVDTRAWWCDRHSSVCGDVAA